MEIGEIVFWILFVGGLFVVAWFVFGDSPTIEQALLIFILAMVVKNGVSIKGVKSDLKHSNTRFGALAKDFKEHIKHERKDF